MKPKKYAIRNIFSACVLVLSLSFSPIAKSNQLFETTQHQNWRSEIVSQVQPGDIVFRRGLDDDVLTNMILSQVKDSKFSHVGIVVSIRPGQLLIVDSMPSRGVGFVSVESFFDEGSAISGTYRRLSKQDAAKLAETVTGYLGRPFDYSFLLNNEKSIYCTKLLALSMRDALIDKEIQPKQILGQRIFYPDDFLSVQN